VGGSERLAALRVEGFLRQRVLTVVVLAQAVDQNLEDGVNGRPARPLPNVLCQPFAESQEVIVLAAQVVDSRLEPGGNHEDLFEETRARLLVPKLAAQSVPQVLERHDKMPRRRTSPQHHHLLGQALLLRGNYFARLRLEEDPRDGCAGSLF
jgi:hypothetical protein